MFCFVMNIVGSAYAQTVDTSGGHTFANSQPINFSEHPSGADADRDLPVDIVGTPATQFEVAGETILVYRGHCEIRKGSRVWTAPQAVIWHRPSPSGTGGEVAAYLESTPEVPSVLVEPGHRETRPYFVLQLDTESEIAIAEKNTIQLASGDSDPLFQRGAKRRKAAQAAIIPVQFSEGQGPILPPSGSGQLTFDDPHNFNNPLSPFRRRVTIGPRFLGERIQAKAELLEDALQPEYVITVTGGVNIVVDNVPITVQGQTFLTRVDLTADKAVVWTDANRMGELNGFDIDANTPFEVYLEGNIIVRQGTSEVRASNAFYNINQRRGLLLNAEVRTRIEEYDGTIRLRAAELRQFSETNFHAKDAYFTTSEFGEPKYRIQASDIFLEERPSIFPNSINPATGLPDTSTLWITSHNNRLFLGDVPVFNTPYLSGPAEDPRIPVKEFQVGYSNMFGLEVESAWNLEALLGVQLPEGVDAALELDVFTKRGPAIGLQAEYDTVAPLFGVPVRQIGEGNIYYLYDTGDDNLGLGRRNLEPIDEHRGRILLRNRSELSPSNTLFTEIGHIFNDDRNFMEQYYEEEWDEEKDLENKLRFEHQYDNFSASLLGSIRTNDFANQTDWLPRADATILGQSVFNTPLIWSMHSYAGYGRLQQAEPPPDPIADPFVAQDFYADSEGLVAMSRHELSLPFNAGPFKVVPYGLGEVAHWQEDLTGEELTRWYGSAGVRASIQFAKYMPHVRSSILGLNGLAHKVTFDADYYIAESSEDLASIPQYNPFDENAQERFRSRFTVLEYGGFVPAMFDPRIYAVRSGAGRSVTAPYHELVDDQHAVRLGMYHRWQTKVGPPNRLRTIDWMELYTGITFFPDAEEDNFGEDFGLLTGHYAWHVSPRTSLLASGAFDFFDGGQKIYDVGFLSQRSERGSIYFGYRNLEVGPIESQLLTTSASYVMTPDLYVATLGASYDIAEGIDRGQSFTITRISENFLFHFGLGYDRSRDNVGVAFSLEPKFGSFGRGSMQLNSLLGIH